LATDIHTIFIYFSFYMKNCKYFQGTETPSLFTPSSPKSSFISFAEAQSNVTCYMINTFLRPEHVALKREATLSHHSRSRSYLSSRAESILLM